MVEDPRKRKTFQDEIYFRIKAGDIIDIKKLYTMLHEWFVENEYCGDDDDFPERYMWERRTTKDRDIYVFWRFHGSPNGDNFYSKAVDVDIKFTGIKDTELMHNGQKFKTQKGTVEIKAWWNIEYDVEMKWRNHWLLKHFLEIYVHRMFKLDFEKHRQELLREAEDLQASIKEYFRLFSFKTGKPSVERVMNLQDIR